MFYFLNSAGAGSVHVMIYDDSVKKENGSHAKGLLMHILW